MWCVRPTRLTVTQTQANVHLVDAARFMDAGEVLVLLEHGMKRLKGSGLLFVRSRCIGSSFQIAAREVLN